MQRERVIIHSSQEAAETVIRVTLNSLELGRHLYVFSTSHTQQSSVLGTIVHEL